MSDELPAPFSGLSKWLHERNRRVLVIDDNPSIHEDFRRILSPEELATRGLHEAHAALFGAPDEESTDEVMPRETFVLDSAHQGETGYRMACSAAQSGAPYAVAFVDMRMPPGWDGVETLERLLETDQRMQAVICTAYSDYSWDQVIERLGQNDRVLLLKKPFDAAEVWQLALALTEKWNLQARNERHVADLEDAKESLEREVSERRTIEDRLRYEATHDMLTGLANRTLLLERLEQCIARRRRHPEREHAVLFMDLDNFKIINDSLGHDAGDRLLVEIAKRLAHGLRELDTVARLDLDVDVTARLGGDEFIILLDDLPDGAAAIRVAGRIQEIICEPFLVDGRSVVVSASIGVAISGATPREPLDILRDADTAMYRAKLAGRGCYAVFDQEMHSAVMERLQIETELRVALDRDETHVNYQPIVRLDSLDVDAVEALVRWTPQAGKPVSPMRFIPIAEESGLIRRLGRTVMETACRRVADWNAGLPDDAALAVSVNVSKREMLEPGFVAQVGEILAATGIPGTWLNVEITESVIMENPDAVVNVLHALREYGIRLHMDDFGTGHSSLSCLHRFPIDVLKIDRAFVNTMGDNGDYCAIVEAIIQLAHNLGAEVIAEGIETLEQATLLRSLGCDFAQGYLFARPMGADALSDLLTPGPAGARPRLVLPDAEMDAALRQLA